MLLALPAAVSWGSLLESRLSHLFLTPSFTDVGFAVWNWLFGEYLHHRNQPVLQIRLPPARASCYTFINIPLSLPPYPSFYKQCAPVSCGKKMPDLCRMLIAFVLMCVSFLVQKLSLEASGSHFLPDLYVLFVYWFRKLERSTLRNSLLSCL